MESAFPLRHIEPLLAPRPAFIATPAQPTSMADDPAKACEIEPLVPPQAPSGLCARWHQNPTARNGVYGYSGETIELEGKTFEISRLFRDPLGDMGDAGTQAEGYPSLAMYKDLILRMHKGMDWNSEAMVWVHEFKISE